MDEEDGSGERGKEGMEEQEDGDEEEEEGGYGGGRRRRKDRRQNNWDVRYRTYGLQLHTRQGDLRISDSPCHRSL